MSYINDLIELLTNLENIIEEQNKTIHAQGNIIKIQLAEINELNNIIQANLTKTGDG